MNIALVLLLLLQAPPEPTLYIDGISVADVDVGEGEMKVTLSAGTGKISLNSLSGLTFSAGTGTYEKGCTFTAKIGDVNLALNHLKYYANPTAIGTDTINIEVDDQGNTGYGGPMKATGVVTVVLPAPPIVRAPKTLNATEDQWRNITGISIAPSNTSQQLFKISISADNATLKLQQLTGLTFIEGNGVDNKNMTFYGSLADVNAALSLVVYKSKLNFNGIDYVTIMASDYNDIYNKITQEKIQLTLAASNDKPVLVFPPKVQKV